MTDETRGGDRGKRGGAVARSSRRAVTAAIVVTTALAGGIGALAAAAQPPASTAAGVYTDAQSQRGEAVSEKSCVSCHGAKLSGSDIGPTLQGEFFMMNWADRTAGDLFEKIHTTMPADAPGSLTPAQTADLIAYIFKLNSFPPGSTELASDGTALNGIKIAKP